MVSGLKAAYLMEKTMDMTLQTSGYKYDGTKKLAEEVFELSSVDTKTKIGRAHV